MRDYVGNTNWVTMDIRRRVFVADVVYSEHKNKIDIMQILVSAENIQNAYNEIILHLKEKDTKNNMSADVVSIKELKTNYAYKYDKELGVSELKDN